MRVSAYPLFATIFMLPNSAFLSSCAECALFIYFLFCDLSSLYKILRPELLHGSMDGYLEFARMFYVLFVGMFFFLGTFLGLRECVSLLFLLVYISHFWRLLGFRECSYCSWAHCFARGSVLEFQEAVRACTMRPISGFKVHSLSLLFFGVFCHFIL